MIIQTILIMRNFFLLMIRPYDMDYNYTLVSEKNVDHVCAAGGNSNCSSRLELKRNDLCLTMATNSYNRFLFELIYPSK